MYLDRWRWRKAWGAILEALRIDQLIKNSVAPSKSYPRTVDRTCKRFKAGKTILLAVSRAIRQRRAPKSNIPVLNYFTTVRFPWTVAWIDGLQDGDTASVASRVILSGWSCSWCDTILLQLFGAAELVLCSFQTLQFVKNSLIAYCFEIEIFNMVLFCFHYRQFCQISTKILFLTWRSFLFQKHLPNRRPLKNVKSTAF